jgi:hypothetical protein
LEFIDTSMLKIVSVFAGKAWHWWCRHIIQPWHQILFEVYAGSCLSWFSCSCRIIVGADRYLWWDGWLLSRTWQGFGLYILQHIGFCQSCKISVRGDYNNSFSTFRSNQHYLVRLIRTRTMLLMKRLLCIFERLRLPISNNLKIN